MSVPVLRQPKLKSAKKFQKKCPNREPNDIQYVILTLKDGTKLVVSSDGYNGILQMENMYLCVVCGIQLKLNGKCKETHKNSVNHKKAMEDRPHLEEFSENLIRKLNEDSCYCTICNVTVSPYSLASHVSTETHRQELSKAIIKAEVYKPLKS